MHTCPRPVNIYIYIYMYIHTDFWMSATWLQCRCTCPDLVARALSRSGYVWETWPSVDKKLFLKCVYKSAEILIQGVPQ